MEYNEIINQYNNSLDILNKLSNDIFNQLKLYPTFHVSLYARFERFVITSKDFVLHYFEEKYDNYNDYIFCIPLEHIYNNTWKKYLSNKHKEIIQKEIDEELLEKHLQEERERKLYEELKAKFEK